MLCEVVWMTWPGRAVWAAVLPAAGRCSRGQGLYCTRFAPNFRLLVSTLMRRPVSRWPSKCRGDQTLSFQMRYTRMVTASSKSAARKGLRVQVSSPAPSPRHRDCASDTKRRELRIDRPGDDRARPWPDVIVDVRNSISELAHYRRVLLGPLDGVEEANGSIP